MTYLLTMLAATVLAGSPDQGRAGMPASRVSSPDELGCAPLLRVWGEEAKGLNQSYIGTYERLVKEACARFDLRLPELCERSYRSSLRRVLAQYKPYLSDLNDRAATGVIRWVAWCTLEACDRKAISADEFGRLHDGYVALYAEILAKVKAHLLPGPGPGLSEASVRIIEEHLEQSREAFERRARDLQSDFLYPALKAPLTGSQRAGIVARYDDPRLYLAWEQPVGVAMTAEQLYVSGAVAIIDQIAGLAQFDILAADTQGRLLKTRWWGRTLRQADSMSGDWPGLFMIRLPESGAASCPTTREVQK